MSTDPTGTTPEQDVEALENLSELLEGGEGVKPSSPADPTRFDGDPVIESVAKSLTADQRHEVLETERDANPINWSDEDYEEYGDVMSALVNGGIDTSKGRPIDAFAAVQEWLKSHPTSVDAGAQGV